MRKNSFHFSLESFRLLWQFFAVMNAATKQILTSIHFKKEESPAPRENRKLSFEKAKARFVHRFTMEHKPSWANQPFDDGNFPAPQYKSDLEWYERTYFNGEHEMATKTHCFSTNPTWPLGKKMTF